MYMDIKVFLQITTDELYYEKIYYDVSWGN